MYWSVDRIITLYIMLHYTSYALLLRHACPSDCMGFNPPTHSGDLTHIRWLSGDLISLIICDIGNIRSRFSGFQWKSKKGGGGSNHLLGAICVRKTKFSPKGGGGGGGGSDRLDLPI